MPKVIQISSLIPKSYQTLAREARKREINIFGFNIRPKGSPNQGQLFFFKFPKYSDKGLINTDEVIRTFGTEGYNLARHAHEKVWQVLPSGACGNFAVCVDPNTVRIESDNCIVVTGDKSLVQDVTLKGSNSSIVVDCNGLRSFLSPGSAHVRTTDSEFERSSKTSSIDTDGLTITTSGNSRYSKCGNLSVTESPGSTLHRVYDTKVQGSPSFNGKELRDVEVTASDGASLKNCKDVKIDGCPNARLEDCGSIDQVELSPYVRITRTRDLAKLSRLPRRKIVEGSVLPSGLIERIPFIGKYFVPTISA